MKKGIDYQKIVEAENYYSQFGYEYIDLPWSVDEDISEITKPIESKDFVLNDKVLVASGEQSFLQLSLKYDLPPGKYFGITPCFRDEKVLDSLHKEYFLKLELFQSIDVQTLSLFDMIDDAQKFFKKYINTYVTRTYEGYDINSESHIELGSYGIREYQGFKWIYGTGCAEPRLTKTISDAKI